QDIINSTFATTIATAATQRHIEVVDVLLTKRSACGVSKITNGISALHLAARNGHIELVKALLKNYPQLLNTINEKWHSALHTVVKGVNREVMKYLIGVHQDFLMFTDRKGNIVLHTATRKKRYEVICGHAVKNYLFTKGKRILQVIEYFSLTFADGRGASE